MHVNGFINPTVVVWMNFCPNQFGNNFFLLFLAYTFKFVMSNLNLEIDSFQRERMLIPMIEHVRIVFALVPIPYVNAVYIFRLCYFLLGQIFQGFNFFEHFFILSDKPFPSVQSDA